MKKEIVVAVFMSVFLLLSILATRLVIPTSASTTHHVYPGQSIQEAINSAQSGDTIFVHAGTYYEHVVVNKSVSLIGENRSTTIIDGSGPVTTDWPFFLLNCSVKIYANNVSISEFTIQNGADACILCFSKNNTITRNIITNGTNDGIQLYSSDGNTLGGNTITDNGGYGVYLRDSSSNTLRDNNISNNYYNFRVHGGEPSYFIQDIDASNTINGKPIYYLANQKDLVIDPSVFPNIGYLALVNSINITVKNLNLPTYNYEGLLLANTANSTITNVSASDNVYGIYLYYSSNNTIIDNSITNEDYGIHLIYNSFNNLIRNNTIINTAYGIDLSGSAHYNVINENVITGSRNAGISLKVARWNTISRNRVTNGSYGIYLDNSMGNTLVENEIASNEYGVYLSGSHCQDVHIKNNTLTNNANGITLTFQANHNVIEQNTITYSVNAGISLGLSPANMIIGNSLVKNGYGVHIPEGSNGNNIYHNNFIFNTDQVHDSTNSTNIWDDDYPSGGNYWSDYSGVDLYSGPYQNETGSDGVGDTPCVIDENNVDRYPLIYPYGYFLSPDVNDDKIVDIVDVVLCAIAFGTKPGDPKWNALVDLNQDGIIDIVDIVIIAIHFGKTYP